VSERLKALVIAHETDNSLTLVDLGSTNLEQIDYPLDLTPATVTMSPVGETIAVFDKLAGKLEVHAFRRGAVLLTAGDIHTDMDFTFSSDGATIYWVDNAAGSFNSIDLWSGRHSIQLAKPDSGLSAMSRSIDGLFAYVSDSGAGFVHMIELQTFKPVLEIRVGSMPARPWGTTDGQYMLVPNSGGDTMTAISTATGQAAYTVAAVDYPAFVNPGWLDSTAAAVGRSGQVAFIDIESGSVTDRYELGGVPLNGVVTSDSRTLAIPVPTTGSLEFFDMRSRARLSSIAGLPRDIGPLALGISNNLCH
jgi:DNA-binding beta-propeller fold protein YncE